MVQGRSLGSPESQKRRLINGVKYIMNENIAKLASIITAKGFVPKMLDDDLLSFLMPLPDQKQGLQADCLAWLDSPTLQIRVPVPVALDAAHVDRMMSLGVKAPFLFSSGGLALDTEGGVFHACVSTRLNDDGPTHVDVDYCLDRAVQIATCFLDVLMRTLQWEQVEAIIGPYELKA